MAENAFEKEHTRLTTQIDKNQYRPDINRHIDSNRYTYIMKKIE